tara:strand:+ start:495 stop:1343 length:849 start_codon:yes stop_codon:yes gene_type:complete
MFIEEILTEKCWKGYEKKGMKTMFGKRVPNCVKNEDVGGKYSNWDHEEPAEYSLHLEKTFGEPDEATKEQTVWHNIDGFKRVVVRDEHILHGSPAPHYDFVYSYVDMEVPEQLSDELAECSGSILIDHLKNEVGARCGSLTANATTLNFCLDVVAGRVEPTKEEYEKRILGMKDMFADGEKYELDWWPDKSGDADPQNEFYKESINEDLRKWFKDKWVRFGPDGKIRGDCARGSKSEGKPKCLPQSKAQSLGKKGRKKAASRKRREDPSKNRKGKAKNVRTK